MSSQQKGLKPLMLLLAQSSTDVVLRLQVGQRRNGETEPLGRGTHLR